MASSRSENLVILIGNLTRDPNLRYTAKGTAVADFGVATNRAWTTPEGETREEVEFHQVVVWNKLAEICSQILTKGAKVYVRGSLKTRTWEDDNGVKHYRTEIKAEDMKLLYTPKGGDFENDSSMGSSKGSSNKSAGNNDDDDSDDLDLSDVLEDGDDSSKKDEKKESKAKKEKSKDVDDVDLSDDLPF